jgi:phage terminase large subunit-like protein
VSGVDIDLPALAHYWEAWARPKQLPPEHNWRSWGFVGGRGMGKTRSCCEYITALVMAGRVSRVAMASFNLDEVERTLVYGSKSGLHTNAPPWFKPEMRKGILIWPNGATATPYTPEVPDGPRGPEHDLFWGSELHRGRRRRATSSSRTSGAASASGSGR